MAGQLGRRPTIGNLAQRAFDDLICQSLPVQAACISVPPPGLGVWLFVRMTMLAATCGGTCPWVSRLISALIGIGIFTQPEIEYTYLFIC